MLMLRSLDDIVLQVPVKQSKITGVARNSHHHIFVFLWQDLCAAQFLARNIIDLELCSASLKEYMEKLCYSIALGRSICHLR